MTFLERARKSDEVEATCNREASISNTAVKCWPELIALIEAARKCAPMMLQATSELLQNVVELDKALDALDRKAGE